MLMVQGSSSLFTSTQLESIFHVPAKMDAVPSISPLVVLKSSNSTSLKSPQSPGGRRIVALAAVFTTLSIGTQTAKENPTSESPFIGVAGFNVQLHYRCDLNLQIYPIVSVDHNEECGRRENHGVICRKRGNTFKLNKMPPGSRFQSSHDFIGKRPTEDQRQLSALLVE